MVEIEIQYDGDLHTTATHGPSKAKISTDAPKDNDGKGELFSPTDLLATSLGTCILTTMGIVARRKQIPFTAARLRLEKHMVTEPQRRVGKLLVEIQMPAGLSTKDRVILERTAFTCPVHHSLHPDVEIPVTFHYPD